MINYSEYTRISGEIAHRYATAKACVPNLGCFEGEHGASELLRNLSLSQFFSQILEGWYESPFWIGEKNEKNSKPQWPGFFSQG